MLSRLTRYTLLFALAVTAFAALPQTSDAQVGWYNPASGTWQYRAFRPLWPWRRGAYSSTVYVPRARATTVYRPVIAAVPTCNTCSPCAQPACATTVRYAPQTVYRPRIVSVPTVSYQATKSCDACTGCCQTVMRPVTTYVQQVQQVAYTTYRPIYSTTCSTCATPVSPCATCGVTGCTTCAASPTSSCANGQCSAGATTYYQQDAGASTQTQSQSTTGGLERPSLLNTQKVEAEKAATNDPVGPNLQAEPDTSEMQEIGGAKLQKFDPPALLNPHDRQARTSQVRPASYQQKVQPRLPVKWQAVK